MLNLTDIRFDGAGYVPERDKARLTGQMLKIWDCMIDGHWRSLREISIITNAPEASVSAQLRNFRKKRFGSHTVEREFIRRGLFKYRLIINEDKDDRSQVQLHF